MTPAEPPGRPIASGRDADLYDLGDGTVLRRYRSPDDDVTHEARVMRLVAEHGLRVPTVYSAMNGDLVMERIDGPTMRDDVMRRPWMLPLHVRTLVSLQRRVSAVPAPDWLMAPGFSPEPEEDRVLHLDLHPENVLLSPDGPVLIDWANAAGGPPGFDAAMTYVIIAGLDPPRAQDRLKVHAFVELFRRLRGRRMIDAFLVAACEHRLADENITPDERAAVARLRKRARRAAR